jgi:DNA-binding GntR family transcriptional regulator
MAEMSTQVDFSGSGAGGGALRGPMPLYVQIAHLLTQRLGVEWPVGARLPSEQALATEFGVNRHTVRRAVALLVGDALVSQRRGRGMEVLRSTAREVPKLVGNVEEFFHTNPETRYRLLDFRRQILPVDVAQRLELPEGAAGCRVERVMLVRGEVVAYLVAYLPEPVGRLLRRFDLRRDTLVAILTRQLGRPVVAADQIIEAGLADPPIARLLEVAAGAPTLRLRFVFHDARGSPVNHVVYHYRADRYVYTARLSTPARPAAPRTAAGTRSRTGSPRARARR